MASVRARKGNLAVGKDMSLAVAGTVRNRVRVGMTAVFAVAVERVADVRKVAEEGAASVVGTATVLGR